MGLEGCNWKENKESIIFPIQSNIPIMNVKVAYMKKAMAKKLTLFLLAGFVCLSTTAAVLFDNADLSGEWKLNEQKSELGQFGGPKW
jgi:hypothetical protein